MTLKTVLAAAACAAALAAQAAPAAAPAKGGSMLVRIAEIEVFPQHLEEYMKLANEVDRASVNHPRLKAKACESLG
jgi:outer membrane protein W